MTRYADAFESMRDSIEQVQAAIDELRSLGIYDDEPGAIKKTLDYFASALVLG